MIAVAIWCGDGQRERVTVVAVAIPGCFGRGTDRPIGPPRMLQALGLVQPRPGAGTVLTASRPPADRAKCGPVLITLTTRTPVRPGDKARVTDAEVVQALQAVAAQLGLSAWGRSRRWSAAARWSPATVPPLRC